MVQEANYDDFVKHDRYFEAMPRPNEVEEKALDMKLIQRGQLEPIKVNKKMWILDGYTRWELLGQRGKKIKFIIMEFESDQEEFEYVIECNVMRRQLNHFQKLEALYTLYKREKDQPQSRFTETWANILSSIKKGNILVKDISEDTGHHAVHVNKTLKELEEKYYISVNKIWREFEDGGGRGGLRNECSLMPKGEEFLIKYKPREKGGASLMIGKITGIDRTVVAKGMLLIDKSDTKTKRLLREGKLSISGEYEKLVNPERRKIKHNTKQWRRDSNVKCPHCDHIAKRDEFELL